ncbi:MAG: hypothetical protein ABIS36_20295 [Chryseolinea sp.]
MNYSVKPWIGYVIGFILATVCSCDSNDDSGRPPRPSDYLPMKKGMFSIYDVSETDYALGVPTTYTYELKTIAVDSFPSSNGVYTYVVYRYKKLPDQSAWIYLDTWSAAIDNQEAIINEANIPYLRLKTPINNGFEWDGNTYNSNGKDEYTMQDVNVSHTYADITYADCITVRQSDNGDLIVFLDQRQEVFSKNVGLVYKETTQLHYCTTRQDCLGQQIVEEGLIYKQTIKSHGVE